MPVDLLEHRGVHSIGICLIRPVVVFEQVVVTLFYASLILLQVHVHSFLLIAPADLRLGASSILRHFRSLFLKPISFRHIDFTLPLISQQEKVSTTLGGSKLRNLPFVVECCLAAPQAYALCYVSARGCTGARNLPHRSGSWPNFQSKVSAA